MHTANERLVGNREEVQLLPPKTWLQIIQKQLPGNGFCYTTRDVQSSRNRQFAIAQPKQQKRARGTRAGFASCSKRRQNKLLSTTEMFICSSKEIWIAVGNQGWLMKKDKFWKHNVKPRSHSCCKRRTTWQVWFLIRFFSNESGGSLAEMRQIADWESFSFLSRQLWAMWAVSDVLMPHWFMSEATIMT